MQENSFPVLSFLFLMTFQIKEDANDALFTSFSVTIVGGIVFLIFALTAFFIEWIIFNSLKRLFSKQGSYKRWLVIFNVKYGSIYLMQDCLWKSSNLFLILSKSKGIMLRESNSSFIGTVFLSPPPPPLLIPVANLESCNVLFLNVYSQSQTVSYTI